jgi:spore coat polysaccharide biosynthesis protein SpsF (cytidylyltransferase family)/glycosyltransferase involved in cell wall biosynthesis
MASTRLPGKVMKEVLGKPLIGYLIERLKLSKKIGRIVVATSLDASNDALVSYLRSIGVDVYRGSEDDVLDRFYQAAIQAKAKTIVRLTADCPLLDPAIVDKVIGGYEASHCVYAATASDAPGYPDGLDVEVFSFDALAAAQKSATLRSEREHVTPFISAMQPDTNYYLRPETDHSSERWTVDEESDLVLVKGVIEDLYPRKGAGFTMQDVLTLKKAQPQLFEVNRAIGRNEGYEKSLRGDADPALVSIVVAVCNGEKYLSEQLESLQKQTYHHLEILIVDDASEDKSVAIAQKAAASDPRIRIHKNEYRLGIVANFMKGAHLAQGDQVCFCDQDDVWVPGKVEMLKACLEKSPQRMMVYSDLEVCDEAMNSLDPSFLRSQKIIPRQGRLREYSLLKNIAPGCTMMFKRPVKEIISALWQDEVFMRLNRGDILDETPVLHDHLVQIVASGLGEIVYYPKALVRYRQHRQNNIGAFYKARRGKDLFCKSLESRIRLLNSVKDKLSEIGWTKIESFLDRYRVRNRKAMPGEWRYFIWLRNDTLLDRVLAYVDCLFPAFYERLRGFRS